MMEKVQDKYKPLSKITQTVSGKTEFEPRFGLNILMAFPFAHISMKGFYFLINMCRLHSVFSPC